MVVCRKWNLECYLFYYQLESKIQAKVQSQSEALVNYLFTTEVHVVFKEALTEVLLPRDLDYLCTVHTDH